MRTRLETLEIAVEGQNLEGSLLAPATSVPGVLFVHGWGGSQQQDLARARMTAGLGCMCLTFDLRGHSRTKEQSDMVSREDNLRDMLAAYDHLANRRGVDKSSIAVVGVSYGAYLAAIMTVMRPVRWLAMRAPALYKDEGWESPKLTLNQDPDLVAYRRRKVSVEENRALRACAAYRGNVLIVESEHDERLPHAVISNYVSALTRPRSLTTRIVSGADHALSHELHQTAYTTVLVNWLTEMVEGARADAVPAHVPITPVKATA